MHGQPPLQRTGDDALLKLNDGYLRQALEGIYRAKGASEDESRTVAAHQIAANLAGHDSHGLILTPSYVERIDKGHIVPGAAFEIERETPTTAVVNGNWGFGYVVTERATRMAIEKARTNGVGALTIHHQSHIGRLGGYGELIAAEGMIGLLCADSGLGPKSVAPLGGRERRLGTNPLCFAAPSGLAGPVLLDMATASVAVGKLKVAVNSKKPIPPGWVVDKDGAPTTDPNDYFAGGTLLPLGGDQAHKGYGLSFVVEMLCGLLTGLGFGLDPQGRHNDGNFLAVFNIEHFRSLDNFVGDMRSFIQYLKETPRAQGFDEILYPGELESRTAAERRANGVPVDDETWRQLTELMDELGVVAEGAE